MSIYIDKAHGVLCPDIPYMFVDSKGRAMVQPSTLSNYWLGLLKRLGSQATFPPNRLRHIFVDERRSEECVPGPSNLGAAQVMGNSVPQWDKAYDLNLNWRGSQAAVDAMPMWRKAMLEQSMDKGKAKMVEDNNVHESSSNTSFESCE